MSDRGRCNCQRCVIRGFMGPAFVITLGVLFLLGEVQGGYFGFWRSWPVILIVLGAFSLASNLASAEGHISGPVPPTTPMGAPPSAQNPQGPFQGR